METVQNELNSSLSQKSNHIYFSLNLSWRRSKGLEANTATLGTLVCQNKGIKSSLRTILGYCSKPGLPLLCFFKWSSPSPSKKNNRFGIENSGNSTGAGVKDEEESYKNRSELSSHYAQVTASLTVMSYKQHSELTSDLFNFRYQIKPPLYAHPL